MEDGGNASLGLLPRRRLILDFSVHPFQEVNDKEPTSLGLGAGMPGQRVLTCLVHHRGGPRDLLYQLTGEMTTPELQGASLELGSDRLGEACIAAAPPAGRLSLHDNTATYYLVKAS